MSVKAELQEIIAGTRKHKLGEQKNMGIVTGYQSAQNMGQGPEAPSYAVAHIGKTLLSNNILVQGISKTQRACEDKRRVCRVSRSMPVGDLSVLPA